jgi:hypothetical protein
VTGGGCCGGVSVFKDSAADADAESVPFGDYHRSVPRCGKQFWPTTLSTAEGEAAESSQVAVAVQGGQTGDSGDI